MLNDRQLLELVEYLATYSEAEDVEMDIARGKRVTKREKMLADSLGKIYCAVHGHGKCRHENWIDDAVKQYTGYISNK